MGVHQTGIQTQSVFFDSLYRILEFGLHEKRAITNAILEKMKGSKSPESRSPTGV